LASKILTIINKIPNNKGVDTNCPNLWKKRHVHGVQIRKRKCPFKFQDIDLKQIENKALLKTPSELQ